MLTIVAIALGTDAGTVRTVEAALTLDVLLMISMLLLLVLLLLLLLILSVVVLE